MRAMLGFIRKEVTTNMEEGEDEFLVVLVGYKVQYFLNKILWDQESWEFTSVTFVNQFFISKRLPHSYANLNKRESVP